MLQFIQIKNFALIEEETIQFEKGIHIITGETGSGKSLILDAVHSILGSKSNIIDIRNEASSYKIEAIFEIKNNELAKEWLKYKNLDYKKNELLLTRELYKDGKNKITINSSLSTISNLRELGKMLAETHKQNEQLEIFKPEKQLSLIDDFGNLNFLKKEVNVLFHLYQEEKKQLKRLQEQQKIKKQKIEQINFEIQEIESLNLKKNELEKLQEEEKSLIHFEKINKNLQNINYKINQKDHSIIQLLNQVEDSIEKIIEIQPKFKTIHKLIQEVLIGVQEMNSEVSSELSKLEYNPNRLEELQTRVAKIQKITKKYNPLLKKNETLEDYVLRSKKQLEQIQEKEDLILSIEKKNNLTLEKLQKLCLELSKKRKETIQNLETLLQKELKEVGFTHSIFKFQLKWKESEEGEFLYENKSYSIKKTGMDEVELHFTANVGEKLYPIKKIASGGEVSRLMLIFKNILGKKAKKALMLFDEIDNGIGGETANQVANKLKNIAEKSGHQIILVTHLQQIARIAEHHYNIRKMIEKNRTISKVHYLSKEERALELAKMISGLEVTKGSFEHAKELLTENSS